ncbi:hypothetical protein PpBr36_02273 [Pyricularia pennisetigena]|uniref:hypothetical protein n=1 Tax=Pyricularia pennisetigena TaxID=1578925 RepID=UPI0011517BB1|nr:hypothetical protein PpBr36_02273 [Pyricularia pennisetigena]TLS30890.1 hypothetical protein PpBr36_02273 [Pyricularia pennisetigena]
MGGARRVWLVDRGCILSILRSRYTELYCPCNFNGQIVLLHTQEPVRLILSQANEAWAVFRFVTACRA